MTHPPLTRSLQQSAGGNRPPVEMVHDKCYGMASENRGPELRLQFRFQDGRRQSLNYSYLVDLLLNSSNEIIMEFTGHQVHIVGKNLIPIYDLLSEHRIRWILELDPVQIRLFSEVDPIISSIQVRRT